MRGSTVSARHTDDGLEVRCSCGATFTLPTAGGDRRCACGMVHRYDGRQLVSTPADGKGPGIGNPNLTPERPDPRVRRPPRGESSPL